MKHSKINKLKKKWKIKHQKEMFKIPLFYYIKKMQYSGLGYLNNDMVQKMKCIGDIEYRLGRKELFLMGLRRK